MSMMRVSLRFLITLFSIVGTLPAFAQSASCNKTAYLTFDTGNMAVAQYIAQVLQQNKIKATFFLANEKTKQGGYSMDDSWKSYWQERVKEGHRFGSHTYDHSYWVKMLVSLMSF
jgi:peptidoglycan/xylan/chitin deacetylase (PgdA/CDA1 family)